LGIPRGETRQKGVGKGPLGCFVEKIGGGKREYSEHVTRKGKQQRRGRRRAIGWGECPTGWHIRLRSPKKRKGPWVWEELDSPFLNEKGIKRTHSGRNFWGKECETLVSSPAALLNRI